MSAGADADLVAERVELARACRVMAHRGLVEDVLGHVSCRVSDGRVLLRCHGPHERGLRFTEPGDIRLVDMEGRFLDGGEAAGYTTPVESPLHLETLKRNPSADAVVHAHPVATVVAELAGITLTSIFGAYDIPAARLAADGIPTFARSVLIRNAGIAADMLAAMGTSPVCLLHGHGVVTVGATVPEAVLCALAIDRLSRIALQVVQVTGSALVPISADDLADLPDLGQALNVATLWRFHLAALAADGWDLPPDDTAPRGEP